MIEDPTWWHNWNDKLGVTAFIFGSIVGIVVFIWKLASLAKEYATKDHLNIRLAQQEEKGRKELELCNVTVQSDIKTLSQTNDAKHDALDEKLDIVIDLVKQK